MARRVLLYAVVPIALMVAYIVAWQVLSPEQRMAVNDEMGTVENIGTFFFFVAGVVGVTLFFRSKGRAPTVWRFFYLLYGLGALFIAAEEVSYGQHILNFNSPEYFKQYSKQKEVNLHNLGGDAMSKTLRRVAEIAVPIAAVIAPVVILLLDRKAFTPGHWPFYTLPLWEAATCLLLADLCYFMRKGQWFGITDADELAEGLWGLACLIWISVLAGRVLGQSRGVTVESASVLSPS
jgi:hypothetical protein